MPRQTFQAAHLEMRHKTYFAVLYVPKDVRLYIGKSKFTRSTETGDLKRAEQRANVFVIGWKAEISRARQEEPDLIISEAMDLNRQRNRKDSLVDIVHEIITDRAIEIKETKTTLAAKEFEAIATGRHKKLSSLIPAWKDNETARGLARKTIDQMLCDVLLLTDAFHVASSLIEQNISMWIKFVAVEKSLSASSVTRIIGFCRNFFRYLQSIDEITNNFQNPFNVPNEYKKSKKINSNEKNKITPWLPLPEEDVIILHNEALKKKDQPLADLIQIGAYTGARIEEICSLKCSDISLGQSCFDIIDAKTNAGIRTTPIHSKLLDRIKQLTNASTDGYLLSGLTKNKYGDRSNAIGKRFGRMKTELNFGSSHVFHSIRKTLVTKLENSGTTENVAADIVGHEKPRITYRLYSGGASRMVKKEAIERISYNF